MIEVIVIMAYLLVTAGFTFVALWASDVMIFLIPRIMELTFWQALITPFFTSWVLKVYPFWGFVMVFIITGVTILWKVVVTENAKN